MIKTSCYYFKTFLRIPSGVVAQPYSPVTLPSLVLTSLLKDLPHDVQPGERINLILRPSDRTCVIIEGVENVIRILGDFVKLEMMLRITGNTEAIKTSL